MSDGPDAYETVARRFRVGSGAPDGRGGWGGVISPEEAEDFEAVEEDFAALLDESLNPRGPSSLLDVVAAAGFPRSGLAVDVGCGSGQDSIDLARRFGARVVAIDPHQPNLDRAAVRIGEVPEGPAVELRLGRAEAIPLPDSCCDLVWCKEVLTFTDLDAALGEFRRVLRPDGIAVVYQVMTGPAMGEDEAKWFASQDMGFGLARPLRPADVEAAAMRTGLIVKDRVDYASEWGEAAQERNQGAGRRLVHVARLLREPERYIERFGETNYRIMLGDCLWHVYRLIGRLWGVAFVLGPA